MTGHHRFMLQRHLTQIEALETAVHDLETRISDALAPFRAAVSLVTAMPAVRATTAAVILAEIGTDMTQVPSAGHLLSWAGLCPRLDERAGTRRSTRTREGARWLKTTLVQAAWAAVRTHDSSFHAQFVWLKRRRGPKTAILAVAASMLTAVYSRLRDGVEFHDLGRQSFAHHDKEPLTRQLLRRLRDLGVEVEVTKAA